MSNRLRISVLIIVCFTVGAGLRQKFSADRSGEDFPDTQTPQNIATAQEVYIPESEGEDEEDILPEEEERWSYLVGSNDPEVIYKKYLLASYLYKKHESLAALPLAISYATQLGRFDEASSLLKELPDITTLKDTLEVPVLMKLLMNTSDLSFAQLKQLKDFIDVLKAQESIDEAQYNMYFFVLTLIKGDMGNAQFYLNALQQGRYAEQYKQLRALEASTQQYGTTPWYYLRAVWAMYLYQQGRRWPARNIGQQIRQEDPTYLLAEQLIAYSSIALQDRKGASLSLQQLQTIDPTYTDVYQFFQAIAHYSLQEYETSILLFQQIPTTSVYYPDVVRYMFLAYLAIEDYDQVGQLLETIIAWPVLQDADVYTLFDSLLFNDQPQKGFELYTRFALQIEKLEFRCQAEMKDKAYICLYGKWGILLASGEYEKAYQILRRIVNWYPRASLFTLLGDLAKESGDREESEERYRRAFLVQEENIQNWTDTPAQIGLQ
jgi:hypothetical protein